MLVFLCSIPTLTKQTCALSTHFYKSVLTILENTVIDVFKDNFYNEGFNVEMVFACHLQMISMPF